jgi:ABC-type polysaccharide/polyol phosphate export permease
MDPAIYHATWVATLWTSVVLLAALLTIRSFSRRIAA